MLVCLIRPLFSNRFVRVNCDFARYLALIISGFCHSGSGISVTCEPGADRHAATAQAATIARVVG